MVSKKTYRKSKYRKQRKTYKKRAHRKSRKGGGLVDSFLSGVKSLNPFAKKEEEVWTIPQEKYNIKNIPIGNVDEVSGPAALKWSNRPSNRNETWINNPIFKQQNGGENNLRIRTPSPPATNFNSENYEEEEVWTIPENSYGRNKIAVGNLNSKAPSNLSWANNPYVMTEKNNRFSPIPMNVDEEEVIVENMNITPYPPTKRVRLERRKKTRKQKRKSRV